MDISNNSLHIDECPQWTDNELYIYDRFKFWNEIVGGISISVVGIIFNLFAIIVIVSMNKRQNIFNYLLILLLVADSAFLLLCFFYEILDHIITSDRLFNLLQSYFSSYNLGIYSILETIVDSIFIDSFGNCF